MRELSASDRQRAAEAEKLRGERNDRRGMREGVYDGRGEEGKECRGGSVCCEKAAPKSARSEKRAFGMNR